MIVVTGANGFIGSALVAALGAEARGLTREHADFSKPFDLRSRLEGADSVIHTAGRAHAAVDRSFRAVNVTGALELARQAVDAGVFRFIFLSSIAVAVSPDDPYAKTKAEGESAIRAFADRAKLDLVIVRPTLVHGLGAPGNWGRLVRAVRSGIPLPFAAIRNRRSFVSIENLVSFLSHVVRSPTEIREPLAVADREPMSTPDAIRLIASQLGRPARMFPVPPALLLSAARLCGRADQMRKLVESLVVDTTRTTELTGWRPS